MTAYDGFRPASRFRRDIELVDETLREGAERSTVSATVEEKADLGIALARAGLRTLVVGMFPDVPHNVALLRRMVEAKQDRLVHPDTRFVVISHLGATLKQTRRTLRELGVPLDSVWILGIHSVSDLQIRYLFPKVLTKDPAIAWDAPGWELATPEERRRQNLRWFDDLLGDLTSYEGGGVLVGLLDTFRASHEHLRNAVALATGHGVRQIRLVDAAGTCTPQQVGPWLEPLVSDHPDTSFYCHFHDDFGLASANALTALASGARGVDVSVGGFANRAGHPALAEVALGLRLLYGYELADFDYQGLTSLSRRVEQLYGLMERATQPVTGVITHSVQSGIRTELVGEARRMFDIIEPETVGANLRSSFGGRSGYDDIARILQHHRARLEAAGLQVTPELASEVYPRVVQRWQHHSDTVRPLLRSAITRYHGLLDESYFTEDEVVEFVIELACATRGNADAAR